MATIAIDTELKIIDRYQELVTESLGSSSTYIRTKETLQAMIDSEQITEANKSEALAGILGAINNSIISSSMSMALQWTKTEKELEFKKIELEKQLDLLTEDIKLKTAQTDKMTADNYATQAADLRSNGNAVIVDGEVVSLSDSGRVYEEMELVKEQVKKTIEDKELSIAKRRETNAGVHKVVADTYVNYGTYSGYTITENGVTAPVKNTTHKTLSDHQGVIAVEQAKGYAWNAWSNAASGLGATIGTALTTESDIFGGTAEYPDILGDWAATIKNLKNVQAPAI